ncbi:prepilin-type N-terminal cleavage/methylation domain-containing protein [Dethiosulfatibacter aminovorans DSM 17477]|uniref:Prepilin-type N-terminal cleavage/methylation domain-containing protein n=1 Tax=Dethiosulfatibacter aminovorans DSM 17477 TaxID=1121476 RepID=A0A1M6D846_9FIRM|nr:prepilin-type N-terminal cleavage/methylation domain-containing protein [Dethiosulfatibacter aminovorans]SHI69402.1 prepilin-type N-terminal cleavage/methylation domain-containing protein [Dethiosulfatibacter aminovorans DSM 17477]
MKNLDKIKNTKGLTLVELLISLSIVAMVISVTVMMSLIGLRSFSMSMAQSDIQYEVRRASAYITEELRNSTKISTTDSGLDDIVIDDLIDGNDSLSSNIKIDNNVLTLYIKADKVGVGTNINTSYDLTTEILLNNYSTTMSPIDVTTIYYSSPDDTDFEPSWD